MYLHNNVFNTSSDERSFNVFVKAYTENIMRYITNVSIDKKIPTQKVLEIIISEVLGNCNRIVGTNYVITEAKSVFGD